MRAVIITRTGNSNVLSLAEVPNPRPADGHVVIGVKATALNFADLLQRRGAYGGSSALPGILGMECSGTILEIGLDVEGWAIGDEVCALTSDGTYAERVAVPATQVANSARY